MKKIIIFMMLFLTSCASFVEVEAPEQFEPKGVVAPLWGCVEMRKEDKEADC